MGSYGRFSNGRMISPVPFDRWERWGWNWWNNLIQGHTASGLGWDHKFNCHETQVYTDTETTFASMQNFSEKENRG